MEHVSSFSSNVSLNYLFFSWEIVYYSQLKNVRNEFFYLSQKKTISYQGRNYREKKIHLKWALNISVMLKKYSINISLEYLFEHSLTWTRGIFWKCSIYKVQILRFWFFSNFHQKHCLIFSRELFENSISKKTLLRNSVRVITNNRLICI